MRDNNNNEEQTMSKPTYIKISDKRKQDWIVVEKEIWERHHEAWKRACASGKCRHSEVYGETDVTAPTHIITDSGRIKIAESWSIPGYTC